MENTKENKAKFFAQYYGQEVLKNRTSIYRLNHSWNWQHNSFYLILKPLSSITDEHKDKSISLGETHLRNFNQKQVDYLRSKGYALPFHDLSVDDLINYNWIKLTK